MKTKLLNLSILLLSVTMLNAQPLTYGAGSHSFTVPNGATITVQAWGAGGGGGGQNGNNQEGGGGGGGGYTTNTFSTLGGQTINFSVGTGGSGGTTANPNGTAGNPGGATTFQSLTANGGGGGPANNGGTPASGGTASGGTTNTQGVNGNVGNGAAPTTSTGAGGAGANGGAGGEGRTANGTGNPGNIPGGGGSGGLHDGGPTDFGGGSGADGRVTINWTCPGSGGYNHLSSTQTITSPPSNGSPATIQLTPDGSMPAGTYLVSYSFSAGVTESPSGSGLKNVTFTTSSTPGTFTTNNLFGFTNSSTITITSLYSGTAPGCSSNITMGNNAPLPVELVNLKSKKIENKVQLEWSTASELNNEKFIIERSNDGKNYKAIGEVAGNGTTLEAQEYHFMDEIPLPGINYYRLKQVDFDGNFEYSPVESVVMRKEGEIAIYPTVTQGELQIALPESAIEETFVNVYSMQGSLVFKQVQEGSGVLTVTLPEMAEGQYIVEVINGNTSKRAQIIKQ